MDIQEKVALVTGSGKRLGRAIALELARQGADIIIHYRTSEEEAQDAAEEVRQTGQRVALLQGDLSSPEEVEEMSKKACNLLDDSPDILINTASTFIRTPLGTVTVKQWDTLLGPNVRGPFFLSQALGIEMKRKGHGKIINFSDATLPYAVPDFTPYAVAKAGVEALTRGLARGLAPEVQVNAILPGAILPASGGNDEGWEAAIKANLLKRRGHPEDIVRAVLYLIREDFLTGVFLPVDGGRSLGR
jgi:pteridine reductase